MIEVRPFALRCALTVLVAFPAACLNGEVDDGQDALEEGAAAVSDEIRKNAESSGKGKKPTPEEPSTDTGTQPEAPPEPAPEGPVAGALYVAPNGSDSNPGTIDRPFATPQKGMTAVKAGGTVYLRGGVYRRDFSVTPSAGTASSRITIASYPGEQAVLQGLVAISSPQYVTFDRINVTWNAGDYTKHMLKIGGGRGWVWQNSEIWGAQSFANLLIHGAPADFALRGNVIRDCLGGEPAENRSHNLYVNAPDAKNGLIERNIFFNAFKGYNVKLAGSSSGTDGTDNVTFRYNTLFNARQANMVLGNLADNNVIERNIFVKPGQRGNVRLYDLRGTGNVIRNNIGFEANRFCDDYASTVTCSAVLGSGNLFPHDPKFNATTSAGFFPLDATAKSYGRYAPR
jgi:hypothetical protein